MNRMHENMGSTSHRKALRCLSLLLTALLSTGTLAATVIEAKYDETTQGRFVITSNDSIASSTSFANAERHSRAVVELGSNVTFEHSANQENKALVIGNAQGRAQLYKENNGTASTLSVNYWLHAIGGTYKVSQDKSSQGLFVKESRCPQIRQEILNEHSGRVLLDTNNSYSLRCEVVNGASSIVRINDMIGVFDLEFPDPMHMRSGTYTATIRAPHALEGAIAFQDIMIRLSVQHSIKVDFPKTSVELKQVSSGSRDSGPGEYSAAVDFLVTAVEPFKIYLACSNPVDNRCSISHEHIGTKRYPIDVQAEIAGIQGGKRSALLNTEKQRAPIVQTQNNAAPTSGRLLLSLGRETTRDMRAGTYNGKVTVIFDAVLD